MQVIGFGISISFFNNFSPELKKFESTFDFATFSINEKEEKETEIEDEEEGEEFNLSDDENLSQWYDYIIIRKNKKIASNKTKADNNKRLYRREKQRSKRMSLEQILKKSKQILLLIFGKRLCEKICKQCPSFKIDNNKSNMAKAIKFFNQINKYIKRNENIRFLLDLYNLKLNSLNSNNRVIIIYGTQNYPGFIKVFFFY